MQVVAGVDVGSSAARALAIDRDGRVVAVSRASYAPSEYLQVGEVDPHVWLVGLCTAVRRLDCEPPAALCVGGQGPVTVAASGEMALTFRHPAGATAGPVKQQAAQASVLLDRFGPRAQPRQMWDFLVSRLGGASGIQSVWSSMEALVGFGEPVSVGSDVGATSGDHAIPPGMVLAPGANDAFLTAWACAIDTPGRGFDPGGKTGGLGVAVAANHHSPVAEYGVPSHVPGVYIVGGPVASHGAIMDWWSGITGREIPELIEAAAAVEPGSGGVMVLPFLEGERAPRWEMGLRAAILGLGPDCGVDVVTRALLESTAYGLAHIARDLAAQGVELDRVICSGGPSRSALWTSIKASVLGVPFDVPTWDEMAAYGAALGAGAAMGWWPKPGDGTPGDWPTPPVTTFEPQPAAVYEEGLERFIALGDEATARLGWVRAETGYS